MPRYVFHLSIPVADLDAARDFYVSELSAELGRETPEWVDILLWGHQITLQLVEPVHIDSVEAQGKRHFGVVLPWQEWQQLAARLEGSEVVISAPVVKNEGSETEQAKIYLKDPSNNILEIKAYRDFQAVLGTDNSDYDSNAV